MHYHYNTTAIPYNTITMPLQQCFNTIEIPFNKTDQQGTHCNFCHCTFIMFKFFFTFQIF